MENLNTKTNKILRSVFLSTFALLVSLNKIVFAQDLAAPNSLEPVFNFIFRGLNLLVYISGAVFVIMLFVAGYKYALSQGDPKGLQGAKDTLTLAVVGFIIIVSVFAFVGIIVSIFGLNPELLDPTASFRSAIAELVNMINRFNVGGLGC